MNLRWTPMAVGTLSPVMAHKMFIVNVVSCLNHLCQYSTLTLLTGPFAI